MDTQGTLVAVLTAFVVNAINTLAGMVVAKHALKKDLNVFLAIVFASLAFRAITVIAIAWYFLSIVEMEALSFSLTFAITGFVFLMGEILFFHQSYEKAKYRVRRPVSELIKKKIEVLTLRFSNTSVLITA